MGMPPSSIRSLKHIESSCPRMSLGKVFLIRHGKAIHNELFDQLGEQGYADPRGEDADLTDLGRQQASSIASRVAQQVKRISGGTVECAYVSPLNRTIQTLQPFLEQLQVNKVCVDYRLIERMGNGWVANQPRTREAIAARYPFIQLADVGEAAHHPVSAPWEEPHTVKERMVCFLRELLDRHAPLEGGQGASKCVVVVSHHDLMFETFGVSLPNCGMVALSFEALRATVTEHSSKSPKAAVTSDRSLSTRFRTSSN
eukprot:GDKI01020087.1.p1 GENE.GDKI01020087.1~~GDKI01020087.1.p1  ORF type:complete len:267 (-),score=73.00 GDKI01020087.1:320-1090(-)